MAIRHISLLLLALVAELAMAMQQPKQNHTKESTFYNNGAMVNQGTFVHQGSFRNNGLVINAQKAYFQTGNVPYQPQYPNPYAQQQAYPQYQPPYQPRLGSFYYNPQETKNRRQQNPQVKIEHPLTPEQKANLKEMEQFAQVKDLMPKKYQRSLEKIDQMAPAEKGLIAEMLVPEMKEDESVQDLKKVMHVFIDSKEPNILSASQQKVNTHHPLFFFNKESLFRETPNNTFTQTQRSPKKLFYTQPSANIAAPATFSACEQFEDKSNPIRDAAFGKWNS